MNHIITISREFGSGGRTVGKRLRSSSASPAMTQSSSRRSPRRAALQKIMSRRRASTHPAASCPQRSRTARSARRTRTSYGKFSAASSASLPKGPCVIVGRCADYILQDKAKCLKVFIHADMAFRAKRIVEVYGEREQSPEQRLRDKDKRRAAYHRFYTNMKWGYAQNYHITLDSGELGIDKCADIIADLYKSKA